MIPVGSVSWINNYHCQYPHLLQITNFCFWNSLNRLSPKSKNGAWLGVEKAISVFGKVLSSVERNKNSRKFIQALIGERFDCIILIRVIVLIVYLRCDIFVMMITL